MHAIIHLKPAETYNLPFSYYNMLKQGILDSLSKHDPGMSEILSKWPTYKFFGFTPFAAGLRSTVAGLTTANRVSFCFYSPMESVYEAIVKSITKHGIKLCDFQFDLIKCNKFPEPELDSVVEWGRMGQSSIVVPIYTAGLKYPRCVTPDDKECSEEIIQLLKKHWVLYAEAEGDPLGLKKLCGSEPVKWFNSQQIDIQLGENFRKRRFLHNFKPVFSWQADVMIKTHPHIQWFIWNVGLGDLLSDGYGTVIPNHMIGKFTKEIF